MIAGDQASDIEGNTEAVPTARPNPRLRARAPRA
jgi:hypothetical protein